MDRQALGSSAGKAGIIVAAEDANVLEQVQHSVVDNVLYNVVFDLVMKVHREEKQARATTAAIKVEKLAADALEPGALDPDVRIDTDFAVYEDGKVMLKGNPLKTVKDLLCPRCKLPRLLYPTDGKGARPADPSIEYCRRKPYIDRVGLDIYGQTWVGPGPGRGKKRQPVTGDGVDPACLPPDQRPSNVLSFPSATCVKCKRCILVTRLNNHMGSCIGNSGRNASRAAAAKISNGTNGNHDGSRKGTPVPSGSHGTSPKKREASVMNDNDGEPPDNTNPKPKKAKTTKKVVLKPKPLLKQ